MRMVNLFENIKKDNKGVSMVTLVITIIVILILSAATFVSSIKTIEKTSYSKYISNVSDVNSAFEESSAIVKGKKVMEDKTKEMNQIYNYVARNGDEEKDFLKVNEVPKYTIVRNGEILGIDLPEMIVESGTGKKVPVKYATTAQGKIFTWPPLDYDNKLYITDVDTVEHKMQTQLKVGEEEFEIKINPEDGTLLDWMVFPEDDGQVQIPTNPSGEGGGSGLDHTHVFTSKTQTEEYFCSEATCTTQMKYYYKCESCDAKGANTYGVGMPLGHLNGEETLVKEANCTEQGIVQNRCSRCETLVTSYKPLNSSNHHGGEEEEITKRSTCKEKGEKTYKCKSCKEVLRTESLELAEHNVDDFEISKEPTCTEKGIKTYFCSVCNQEMKTEEIPTLDHNEENVVTTKEPTCIETGIKTYSCSNCNQEVKTVEIEALGHEHSKSEVTKEATCKEKGVRTKQCIRCTDTITEEIPIDTIKHYGTEETKETKKATCTETGVKETICSLCKKVLQSETIAALGHDWNVPERPRKCNRCGLEENLTAQAVYTSDDKTLTFIREFEIYETGDTFNGKTVASAYIGIEQENYARGWESISGDVKSVVFRDEIKPKTLKKWFYGFSNCENMDIAKLNTENVTNMHSMFADCRKLTTLDVSHFKTDNVTDMLSMFNSCSNVEILDVSNFNTENVTEMAYMFWGCNNLTALDVSKFKTAKVISLDCMFRECKTLKTLDVSNFDTSLVISMGSMFSGCTSLETLDVSNFNTENVIDFSYMFLQCQQLKAIDVSGFKTSSAQSMSGMFNHCRNLEVIDVSNFNTEKVTDMENMFYLCEKVKVLDLSNWKTDLVTDMNEMFTCCYKVQKLDLSGFSTEKVTDMHNIFQACRSLEEVTLGPKFAFKDNAQNEGNQYLPAPQDVYIPGATGFWYDISHFKEYAPEEIPNNYAATYVAIKQEAILAANSTWYSQGGTEISRNQISSIDIVDFYDVTGKTIVDQWDASINIINTNDPQGPITAYIEDDGLGNNTYKLTLSGNNSGKIYANEDSSYAFSDKAETDYFTSLTNLNNAQLLDTSKVTTMQTMFSYAGNTADSFILSGIEQWNTKLNKSFDHMFDNAGTAAKTFDIGDLSGWDTSNVTTMAAMFRFSGTNADTFDIGNLSGWDTSKVTAMNAMFNHTGCEASIYNIGDLSNWDTSSVTTMGYMFSYAGNKAKVIDIGDLSTKTVQKSDGSSYIAWDTSKVSSMHGMFEGSYHNTESFDIGNLGSWNTSNVKDMAKIFTNTAVYSEEVNIGDLSSWDTSSVTDMSYMFYQFANHECDSLNLGNLGTWDTSSVTNMTHMFYEPAFYAEYFYIGDLSNWDTSNVTDMSSMFSGLGANKTSLIDIGDLSTKTVQKSDGSSYIAWDTSKVTNMSRMFYWVNHEVIGKADFDDLSNWDTSSVTDMSYMFFLAGSLESLDISGWDTSSVTSMTGMFQECYELNTIYVSDGWSTASLDMDAIYSDGTAANGDMFRYSSKLVGGNGTAYATNHLEYLEDEDGLHPNEDKVDDTAYAIIDGKDGKLGYLTNNVHLTYEDVEVGFTVAPQLIIKSKVFTSADIIKYEFADTESSTYASINETTGEITGIAAGTAKVKVTITNAKGQTISDETDVTVSANYTYNVVYKSASGLDLGGTTVTNKNGTTNTITAPQITGYNTPASQSVTWDTETKTITFTYSPTSYNITINCNGGSGVSHIIYNIETETFTIGTPTREGYTFVGWTDVDGITHETVTIEEGSIGARNYTASWKANTNTAYTVKHWQQKITDETTQNYTNYTLYETQNLTGTTGASVTPSRKSYTGFTAPTGQTVTIASDGSTEVNYYYTRNKYTVTLNKGTGIASVSGGGSYKYGATVTINATISSGYAWSKWTGTHNTTTQKYSFTMPASAVTDTANAVVSEIAQAIYTSSDGALTFVKSSTQYKAGGTYNGKTITAVYTGFETTSYSYYTSIPWYNNASNITKVTFANEIKPISTAYWFFDFENCATFDVENLNTSNATSLQDMFFNAGRKVTSFKISGMENWNTSKVTNMMEVFRQTGYESSSYDIGDISKWDTSKVTTTRLMFRSAGAMASTFNIGNLKDWDVSNVTDMDCMFDGAGGSATTFYIGDLSGWKVSKVTNMSGMFSGAGANAKSFNIGNLKDWDVSNVVYFGEKKEESWYVAGMFERAGMNSTTFYIGDISGWNTSSAVSMFHMFQYAGEKASYSLNLSKWNVSKVTSYTDFNTGVTSKITAPKWVN